jgi:hypothetical protein
VADPMIEAFFFSKKRRRRNGSRARVVVLRVLKVLRVLQRQNT